MKSAKAIASCVINVVLVALVVTLTLALRSGIVTPVKRGFFCGDRSIRYSHPESESVSTKLVIVIGTVGTFLLFSITEYCLSISKRKRSRSTLFCGFQVSEWIVRTAKLYLYFLLGFCISILLVELGKISTGVLRPNFFSVCRPNVTCDDPNVYHEHFQCLSDDQNEISDMRKSFPSGHASAVSFMSVYVCLYLHFQPSAFGFCFLLRPVLQLTTIAFAWVTSLTRISDNVHHVSDVIVGLVLGTGVAFWSYYLAQELLRSQSNEGNDSGNDEDNSQIDRIPLEMSIKSDVTNNVNSESKAKIIENVPTKDHE